jgi:trigger factor
MNISRQSLTDLSEIITINVKPEDYRPAVEKTLKKYAHTAQVPGFRPGKVPAGMIKKMYGKSILVEELNSLLSESLGKYIYENHMPVLGSPISLETEEERVWEDGQDFEFQYEIGLAPNIEVNIDKISAIPYYLVKVDEEMVDNNINEIRRRYGKYSYPEVSEESHILYGDFDELDEAGNVKEEGIKTATSLAIEMISDTEHRAPFIGLKKDDSVVFNPLESMVNETEVSSMLKIDKASPAMNSNYKFTVKSINKIDKAELNQEFFDKIYGEGAVKNEEEFRGKVREGIVSYFERSSENKLQKDLRNKFLEELDIPLPDDFLKRTVKENAEKKKDGHQHDFEHEYYHMAEDLRWSLIGNYFAKENNLTVSEDEVKNIARGMVREQFAQYGIYDAPPDKIEEMAKSHYLERREIAERIERSILDDKVFAILKTKINLDLQELPYAEFVQKLNEKTEHELEHHHEH